MMTDEEERQIALDYMVEMKLLTEEIEGHRAVINELALESLKAIEEMYKNENN